MYFDYYQLQIFIILEGFYYKCVDYKIYILSCKPIANYLFISCYTLILPAAVFRFRPSYSLLNKLYVYNIVMILKSRIKLLNLKLAS